MKHPEREEIKVPRLTQEVKDMNGKSTERLTRCLDHLCDILDDEPCEAAEDGSVKKREDD